MTRNPASDGLLRNYDKVSGNSYDASDYTSSSEVSQGTAETHEQFSDTFAAGTVQDSEANGTQEDAEQ